MQDENLEELDARGLTDLQLRKERPGGGLAWCHCSPISWELTATGRRRNPVPVKGSGMPTYALLTFT